MIKKMPVNGPPHLRLESYEPPKDDDIMTWGKHKGKKLIDVPVNYLHYVCHNFEGEHVNKIKDYCKSVLEALKEENPDLIWKL